MFTKCAGLALLGACCCAAPEKTSEMPRASERASGPHAAKVAPQVDATQAERQLACPDRVYGSSVSSVRTDRGIAVVFAVERLPAREELRLRARRLVAMYNSVYGPDAEGSSWAKLEASPDGARIEFAVLTEPDLDNRHEPIPEQSELELRELRERIDDSVVRMQRGEACPLVRDLMQRGARPLPELAHRPPDARGS